tara:strand:- start:191 stop:403 length:213 start_codon:yes stop_codon:yes gene_type:complete
MNEVLYEKSSKELILEEHIRILKCNIESLKSTIEMQLQRIEDRDNTIKELKVDISTYESLLCEKFSQEEG